MPVSLVQTLEHGSIRVGYHTADFESAVRGLLVQPLLGRGVSASRVDEIVDGVLQRERTGSTCSGPIALPHARIPAIPAIIAGIGINADGIWPEADARVMLAFISPTEAAGEHLRFLSLAAKTFRDQALLQRIVAAASADDVLAELRDRESASQ